jgi:hypothetical protein
MVVTKNAHDSQMDSKWQSISPAVVKGFDFFGDGEVFVGGSAVVRSAILAHTMVMVRWLRRAAMSSGASFSESGYAGLVVGGQNLGSLPFRPPPPAAPSGTNCSPTAT